MVQTTTRLDFDIQTSITINGVPIKFSSGSETSTWVYATASFRVGTTPPTDLSALADYAYTAQSKIISEGEYVAISNGLGSYALVQIVDSQSLHHGGVKNGVVFNSSTVTITAPAVTEFSPADELVGVPVDENIRLTFSEQIQRGSGSIVLKNAAGSVVEKYDAATSKNISINGTVLTIDPGANFQYGAAYTLELAPGSVKDLAGESYAGSSNYNFATAQDPASHVTSTSLNFDVQTSVTINGVPMRFSSGSESATWIYASSSFKVGGTAPSDLSALGKYTYTSDSKLISEGEYVAVSNGLGSYALVQITDSKSIHHGGLLNGVTFNSSTTFIAPPDTVAPAIVGYSPANFAPNIAVGTDIAVTFSEAIQRGAGSVVLKNSAGAVIASYDASSANINISGSTLTINPAKDLDHATGYRVEFGAGVVKDLAGNAFSGTSSYTFTTAAAPDTTAPSISAFSGDNHAKFPVANDIVFTFSEAVQRGSGSVILRNSTGAAIAVYDAASSANLKFSGSSLTVNPSSDLGYSSEYSIEITSGAVKDLAGNGVVFKSYRLATAGAPEAVKGSSGADLLLGKSGDDLIDGGAGIDTLKYSGASANFSIVRTSSGFSVTDKLGVNGNDNVTNVERLHFTDSSIALDIDGVGGQAYRVYQAAFNRSPDLGGLGYWMAQMDQGASLKEVASGFVASAEFKTAYGANPSNAQIVNQLYQNVLHRAGETAGLDYWVGVLDSKAASVAEVLAGFSESAENQAALIGTIGNGFAYTPYG
ncbi:Ig-like domain-containing protein [Pseudoduganella namucuonensis]|uniref:DUF4214 domain-containing protein n=1 Tax=Pseudoduganella namucuonensis TaxID=1035707 RepID=A0A1I7LI24_9BURK|nr:Ig-like domain-containing protein [Pseudoduganella namucuonensis]SFV09289.1 protein of unknown function [Pseudoduganella namucuonensis]